MTENDHDTPNIQRAILFVYVFLDWSTSGDIALARYQHTASVLTNGHVLVAGGIYLVSGLNSSEDI